MTDSRKDPGNAVPPLEAGDVRNRGRRRLLQAGASAVPVVMTVASRPVLAQVQCLTPSAAVSGNASGQAAVFCTGVAPSVWSGTGTWPTYTKATAKFKDFFSPDLLGHANILMQEVLTLAAPAGSNDEVAQYVLAALLNHESNKVPDSILPLAVIHKIWADYNNGNGTYQVNGSVSFNGSQIVTYIKSTIG